MVITWWYGRKYFRVSFLKKDILSVAIGCLAIWTICSISEKYISSVLISTVFSVTASVVIYMIVHLDEEVANQIDEMYNHVYKGNCFDNIRLNEFVQNLQYILV